MILQRLYEYAVENHLLEEPAFESKRVRWLVRLTPKGKLRSLDRQIGGETDKSGVDRGILMRIPRRVKRTIAVDPNFLVDDSKYVFGLDLKETPDTDRARSCMQAFTRLIGEAADETKDEGLLAAKAFYASDEAEDLAKHSALQGIELSAADLFSLAIERDGEVEPLADRSAIREWWARRFDTESDDAGLTTTCLVTGDELPVERIHPPIKGLWGGQSTGTALVSFNFPSVESYGLEQNANAPVSKKAALGYTNALNRLLSREPGERRHVTLPGGITVCVFTLRRGDRIDAADLVVSALDPLLEDWGDDTVTWRAVEALYGAPWRGSPGYAPREDVSPIYVLALSANAARVVVRDWFEGQVRDVAESLKRYFDDLAIIDPFTHEVRRAFPLRTPRAAKREAGEEALGGVPRRAFPQGLLDSLRGKGEGEFPADLARGVVMAALDQSRALPLTLLDAALRRIRAEAASSRTGAVSVPRAAIIKAVLNREFRRPASALRLRIERVYPEMKEIPVTMDSNCTIPAYLLGRLMAVLEQAQAKAIRDANATVVDRAYGAASATPATVMPRLLRGVRHHLSKLKGESPGLAITYERLLDEICEKFPEPEHAFPATLDIHEQGLFSLGYYQQRAELFKKRVPKEEASEPASETTIP
ncbi:MAG: type I-C CRISPR-associated protein Cas8c/Csd1 [Planctomycetes bacterium]|nr:type I-C CRISPR-associated protein Cas8c/Csd1 [Planctomycetota bacterium]MBI3843130.1 type I-C CRISPR-associated protein Cas8c/Csd1 [Planctomycetota bacterium]